MSKYPYPPAIFLMGPTASGKSSLAINLAREIGGEIISVDSVLVYKGMNIGTAKPSVAQRYDIPHHLIDILDPSENFSTGQFRTLALTLMEAVNRRGRIPILTGGTMLYFNSLSNGLAVLPEADSEIRKRLDAELAELGSEFMHQRLTAIDPESALRIHPNDPQRIQRALEVYEISGKPLTSFFHEAKNQSIPFQIFKLVIAPEDRKCLHSLIAQRFIRMLEHGFVEEVEALFRRGDLSEKMPSIRAVGYRQIWAYLNGDINYATMVEKGIAATRQLAKRQFTWLRKENDALHYDSEQINLTSDVLVDVKKWLLQCSSVE